MFCQFGQHFPVQADFVFFQFMRKNAVRQIVLSGAGVDFDLPKTPKIPFFLSEVVKAVDAGVKQGFFSKAFF